MTCLCKANQDGWTLAEIKNDRESAITVFTEALKVAKVDPCYPKLEMATAIIQCNLACQHAMTNQVEKARELWLLAAQAGDAAANYWLGCLLEKENSILCISHFKIAALKGHKGAIGFFEDHPSLIRHLDTW